MADEKINELSKQIDDEKSEKIAQRRKQLDEERIALEEKLKSLKEDTLEYDNAQLEIEDKIHESARAGLEIRLKELELRRQGRELTQQEIITLGETKDALNEIDASAAKRKKAQENINALREKERNVNERIKRDVLGIVKAEENRLGGLKKILEVASKVTPEEAFFTLAAKLQEYSVAILSVATSYDEVAAKVRQATNTSGEYNDTLVKLTEANREFGISMDEVGGSIIALRENFGQFSSMSKEASDDLVLFTTKMQKAGISAETTTRFMTTASKSFGMGVEQTKKYQVELYGFAKANNISTKTISDGLANVMPRLAAFGKDGPKIFKELAFASKNLGIEMGNLLNITEQFTTFEGAAEAAGNLNAVLGGNYLDTMELLRAANEDPMKAMDLLRGSLEKTGKSFDQLDNQTKRLFADIMKQDLDTTAKMFSKTSEEAKKAAMTEEQFNKSLESFVPLGEKMKQLVAALTPVFQTLASVLGAVITVLTKIATHPVGRFLLTIVGILALALGAVTALAVGFVMFVSQLMLLGKAFSFITPFFGGMRAGITNLASTATRMFPAMGQAASRFASSIGSSIRKLTSSIGSGFSRLMTAIANGLKAFAKGVSGAAPEIAIGLAILAALTLIMIGLGFAVSLVVKSLTPLIKLLIDGGTQSLVAAVAFVLFAAAITMLGSALAILGTVGWLGIGALTALIPIISALSNPLIKMGNSLKDASNSMLSLVSEETYKKFENLKNILSLIANEMSKISKASLAFEDILSSPFMIAMAVAAPALAKSGETSSISANTLASTTTTIQNSSNNNLRIEIPIKLDSKIIASVAEDIAIKIDQNGGIALGSRNIVKTTSEKTGKPGQ